MPKSTVSASGGHMQMDDLGWYTVTLWYRLDGGGRHHEWVEGKLAWHEATGMLLDFLDANRPG